MRIPRIYQNKTLHLGDTVELDEWAVQHSVTALRLRPGFTLHLFNGHEEGEFEAELVALGKRRYAALLRQFHPKQKESPLSTHLGQSISRGDRMDFALQKAVELGVTEITPLFTEHCSLKLSEEQLENRFRHWQNILISACEQSDRCKVPVLHPSRSLSEWLSAQNSSDVRIVFEPGTATTINDLPEKASQVSFLVGPEGGFSQKEVVLAEQSHFKAVRMGPRIVRTETAAIIALSLIQTKWGDLG